MGQKDTSAGLGCEWVGPGARCMSSILPRRVSAPACPDSAPASNLSRPGKHSGCELGFGHKVQGSFGGVVKHTTPAGTEMCCDSQFRLTLPRGLSHSGLQPLICSSHWNSDCARTGVCSLDVQRVLREHSSLLSGCPPVSTTRPSHGHRVLERENLAQVSCSAHSAQDTR